MLDAPFFHLLLLIIVANACPILIRNLVKGKWSHAVDADIRFIDGHPLFGISKTWRGVITSLIITPVVGIMLGYPIETGILISLLATTGDLFSSFIKRRLKCETSSMLPLLDQIPESLLPALCMMHTFKLDLTSIFILVLFFTIFELTISKILYRLGIRKHPY